MLLDVARITNFGIVTDLLESHPKFTMAAATTDHFRVQCSMCHNRALFCTTPACPNAVNEGKIPEFSAWHVGVSCNSGVFTCNSPKCAASYATLTCQACDTEVAADVTNPTASAWLAQQDRIGSDARDEFTALQSNLHADMDWFRDAAASDAWRRPPGSWYSPADSLGGEIARAIHAVSDEDIDDIVYVNKYFKRPLTLPAKALTSPMDLLAATDSTADVEETCNSSRIVDQACGAVGAAHVRSCDIDTEHGPITVMGRADAVYEGLPVEVKTIASPSRLDTKMVKYLHQLAVYQCQAGTLSAPSDGYLVVIARNGDEAAEAGAYAAVRVSGAAAAALMDTAQSWFTQQLVSPTLALCARFEEMVAGGDRPGAAVAAVLDADASPTAVATVDGRTVRQCSTCALPLCLVCFLAGGTSECRGRLGLCHYNAHGERAPVHRACGKRDPPCKFHAMPSRMRGCDKGAGCWFCHCRCDRCGGAGRHKCRYGLRCGDRGCNACHCAR